MWWVRCVLCLTLVGCADEEAEPEPFDAPPPVALRCDGAPPPAVEREIALDVQWQMIRMGPCGDVLYQEVEPSPTDPVWRTSLVDEAVREPQVIAEASSPVGTTFAPDGKTLVVREPERLSLFDPSSGETQVLAEVAGATLGWVRDAEDPTRVSPVVCADGTARIVDPAGDRELSDDAFSCEAFAEAAPVLVYRRASDGVLVRHDLSDGVELPLPDVDFADEAFAPDELARDDHISLSPDGDVLVHTRMWRRPFGGFQPEGWATIFETRTGTELGPVRGPMHGRVDPIVAPGYGHVLLFQSDDRLSVVTPGLEMVFYEGWEVAREPVEGMLVVRDGDSGDVWLMDAGRGILNGPLVENAREFSGQPLAASEDRKTLVIPRIDRRCVGEEDERCSQTLALDVWRPGEAAQTVARANGIQIRWVGNDGRMLVVGGLFEDEELTSTVNGIHLLDADGTVVTRWVDGVERGLTAPVGDVLLMTFNRSGPRGGEIELIALDPTSGRTEVLDTSPFGVQFWTDANATRLLLNRQWFEDTEGPGRRVRNRLTVGPVPSP